MASQDNLIEVTDKEEAFWRNYEQTAQSGLIGNRMQSKPLQAMGNEWIGQPVPATERQQQSA